MANSDLKQKEYILPDNIIKTLEYKKDSDVDGNKRINNWLESGKATYEQLKRFKHDIEEKYNESEWQDILRWLNNLLNRERGAIYMGKKIKSNIGLDNAFRQSHFKDSNTINATKIPTLTENKMENKKTIKLTESDLIKIIESKVNEIHDYNDSELNNGLELKKKSTYREIKRALININNVVDAMDRDPNYDWSYQGSLGKVLEDLRNIEGFLG